MKRKIPFSLLAAAAALGISYAEPVYTTPVGYVTQEIDTGFNFLSPTVHAPTIMAGTLDVVTETTAQDESADFEDVLGVSGESGTYILEILNDEGVIQEVTTWTTDTLDVASLAGVDAPVSYKIRQADTFASVFGANNEAGLASGSFSSAGADQIWLWNGAGWDKFYYDQSAPPEFTGPGWVNIDTNTAVDPDTLNIVYADSLALFSVSGNDIVFAGEVKLDPTEISLNTGFNFVGSVVPTGATLASAFGADNSAGLTSGSFSSAGADQLWIFNGTGWDKYYYDLSAPPEFTQPAWVNIESNTSVDAEAIDLPSGFVINAAQPKAITQGVPNYSSD